MNGTNTIPVSTMLLEYMETYTYSCMEGYRTTDELCTVCQYDGTLTLAGDEPNCTSKHLTVRVYTLLCVLVCCTR